MKIDNLNGLTVLIAAMSIYAGGVTATTLTSYAQNTTTTNGASARLKLTVEDTLIAGVNQQWGSVLVEISDKSNLTGYQVEVWDVDYSSNDDNIYFNSTFTAGDLGYNAGTLYWEYNIPIIFDPGLFLDDAGENALSMSAYVRWNFPSGNPSNDWQDTAAFLLNPAVSSVPVPAAVWLFGSGLIGMAGVARGMQRKSYSRNNQLQPT